jgi:hypothetical protein
MNGDRNSPSPAQVRVCRSRRGWRTKVLNPAGDCLKERPDILERRREIVEHPCGSIKHGMWQVAFLMSALGSA